jgi:hypothetical protein
VYMYMCVLRVVVVCMRVCVYMYMYIYVLRVVIRDEIIYLMSLCEDFNME